VHPRRRDLHDPFAGAAAARHVAHGHSAAHARAAHAVPAARHSRPPRVDVVPSETRALHPTPAMSALLQIENVTKRFGGLCAISQCSLAVEAGRTHGIIGPNGAGKTTLFNLITGIYKPTEGAIR